MLPVIALVGRPNVGKSTFFNRLTRSRDAIVADFPGLTRDRQYGQGRVGPGPYIVVDTGGFEPVRTEGIVQAMAGQAELAIEEADVVLFLTDARAGLTPQDIRIAQHLRRADRPVVLLVNKAEGLTETAKAEFYELGLGEPHLVSGAHGQGVRDALDLAFSCLPEDFPFDEPEAEEDDDGPRRIKVTLAGRPNAGKSTLINALVGEERVIAFDMPGTTRDAIKIDFEYDGRPYELVDTAGLRKKGRVFEAVEKFSVVKTLQAIEDANVVILVVDAKEGVSEGDAHIAGYVLEAGRALVVAVNKWDLLDSYERERFNLDLERKLHFLRWARMIRISALKRNGLNHLMRAPLCTPGRQQSPGDRDSRQCFGGYWRVLSPLSRGLFPRYLQSCGHAASRGIPHEGQSVRGRTEKALSPDALGGKEKTLHRNAGERLFVISALVARP